jgi:hypothetical protein
MDERDAAQAAELVRGLRGQLHKMTNELVRLEHQHVSGKSSQASAIRREAAELRLDISQAQVLIDRLQRRYLNSPTPRKLSPVVTDRRSRMWVTTSVSQVRLHWSRENPVISEQEFSSSSMVTGVPQEERAQIDAVEHRLAQKYAELPHDHVARVVQHVYARFHHSKLREFVPLLVERRAAEQLARSTMVHEAVANPDCAAADGGNRWHGTSGCPEWRSTPGLDSMAIDLGHKPGMNCCAWRGGGLRRSRFKADDRVTAAGLPIPVGLHARSLMSASGEQVGVFGDVLANRW